MMSLCPYGKHCAVCFTFLKVYWVKINQKGNETVLWRCTRVCVCGGLIGCSYIVRWG